MVNSFFMSFTLPAFTVNFFLPNSILKIVCTIAWSSATTIVISVSPLMSPDFSHRYPCSISTSFSSKLRGCCSCSLFPCHICVLFFATLSFICLAPFCSSVLSRLAACNIAQLMLCWCLLTNCISVSSLLSSSSTSFVISNA